MEIFDSCLNKKFSLKRGKLQGPSYMQGAYGQRGSLSNSAVSAMPHHVSALETPALRSPLA